MLVTIGKDIVTIESGGSTVIKFLKKAYVGYHLDYHLNDRNEKRWFFRILTTGGSIDTHFLCTFGDRDCGYCVRFIEVFNCLMEEICGGHLEKSTYEV